jgi:Peptidase family S41
MAKATPDRPAGSDGPREDPLARAVPISEFLRTRTRLGLTECQRIVKEAILVIEGLYVHLPLKRAMYAVDPLRRLRLLQLKLDQLSREATPTDDMWFHREMSETLISVRDLHTIYALPAPFDRAVAFVPFQIEASVGDPEGKDSARKYIVSKVIEDLSWFKPPNDFKPGVEVTFWNDIEIARAVELEGERNAGSNPAARLARGLVRLTVRPLVKTLPPDEEQVTLRYVGARNKPRRLPDVQWRVAILPNDLDIPADGVPLEQALGEGLDHEADIVRLLWKRVHAPRQKGIEWSLRAPKNPVRKGISTWPVPSSSESLQARIVEDDRAGNGQKYGYIRIRSFTDHDHKAFLCNFIKIVEHMPPNGLIIDVRDNPGGYILNGERLLQVLTPRTIRPETVQFINSTLSLQLCGLFPEFLRWEASIRRAQETCTTFSSDLRLSPMVLCNNVGQRYYGPVVLITNALSYSATDIFAAGFQDHKIGRVLGTDGRTGAGGANMIVLSKLRERFKKVQSAADKVFGGTEYSQRPVWPFGEELPRGADLHIAIRRTLRVREQSGMELEDLGVMPDEEPYLMTKNDVLNNNVDLIAKAAELLKKESYYDLKVGTKDIRLAEEGSVIVAKVKTQGVEWLDVFVDGRPSGSKPVRDGDNEIKVGWPFPRPAKRLVVRGYGYRTKEDKKRNRAELVAARKILLLKPEPQQRQGQ